MRLLLVINYIIIIITYWLLDRRRCHEAKKSPFWLLLLLRLFLKHYSFVKIHWLAHAEDKIWLLSVLEDNALVLLLLYWHFLLEQLLLPLAKELFQLVLRLTGLNAGHVEGGIVIAATCHVEIDLRFSRPFQITAKWIVLDAGFGDAPMQCLLHKVLATFALPFPGHRHCLLAEGIIIAACCETSGRVGNERIVV